MGAVFNTGVGTVVPAQTGRIAADLGVTGVVGVARLPTDPLFTATLTLRNVVAGSRYRVTRADTGAELATGVAAGSGLVDVEIAGVAAYANPQQVNIAIRQGTTAPKYQPYSAVAEITKSGGQAFIAQVPDNIA